MANLRRRRWLLLLLPAFFLAQFMAALNCLRNLRPDAVHAHWIVPQGIVLAAVLSCSRARSRSVCTAHGSDVSALRGRIWSSLRRWVAERCDQIIAVSEPLRDRLIAEGCPAGKTGVIPMGVDLSATFIPGEQARSRSEILFVGRLVRSKGVDVLLRAMPGILEQHPEATLTLVGDGPEKVSLHSTAHSLGIDERVHFAGALPHSALPFYYRRAAILAMPSREEGFGLVLVEALGCGCPVAASDLPALRAIVTDGKTGRLFRRDEVEDLTRVVCDIIGDPNFARSMAEQGRLHVRQRYDWSQAAQSYRDTLLPASRS